jgi:hypothetical protein
MSPAYNIINVLIGDIFLQRVIIMSENEGFYTLRSDFIQSLDFVRGWANAYEENGDKQKAARYRDAIDPLIRFFNMEYVLEDLAKFTEIRSDSAEYLEDHRCENSEEKMKRSLFMKVTNFIYDAQIAHMEDKIFREKIRGTLFGNGPRLLFL